MKSLVIVMVVVCIWLPISAYYQSLKWGDPLQFEFLDDIVKCRCYPVSVLCLLFAMYRQYGLVFAPQ